MPPQPGPLPQKIAPLRPSPTRRVPGGLRAQVTVMLALISVVTLAALAVVMTQLTKNQVVNLSREHTQDVGRIALAQMRALQADTPLPVREQRLRAIQTHGQLGLIAWQRGDEQVMALDANHTALVDTYNTHQATYEVLNRTTTEVGDELFTWTRLSDEDGQHTIIVATPVRDLQEGIAQVRALFWAYLAINAVLITILGYALLTFLVMRPLNVLDAATQRAAAGDFTRALPGGPHNEFGALYGNFNLMLRQLDAGRDALQAQLHELSQINAQLQRTQDSLIRSEKLASVGRLAAGVAHEIGNPLAAVAGFTELLLDAVDDASSAPPALDEMAQMLKTVQTQTERIQTIIKQLVDFSRDDSHEPVASIDLSAALQEAVDLARASKRTQHVHIQAPQAQPEVRVQAVASQVVQVLLNLIFNAADAMVDTPQPQLRLHITREHQRVLLQVEDNGPGFEPRALQRAFDPFFTTKPPGQGTGLGLATSLRLIQRFGGDIRIQNLPAGGSRVEVSLEASPDQV